MVGVNLSIAMRNVTGEDLYEHHFWEHASRFLPYVALPDFSAWANYADTAYKGIGGSSFFGWVSTCTSLPSRR